MARRAAFPSAASREASPGVRRPLTRAARNPATGEVSRRTEDESGVAKDPQRFGSPRTLKRSRRDDKPQPDPQGL